MVHAASFSDAQLNRGAYPLVELYLPWSARAAWEASFCWQPVTDENPIGHMAQLGEHAAAILSGPLIESLSSFRHSSTLAALILRDCPIDKALPPTPYSGYLPATATPVACAVNLALYALMGLSPIVYKGENRGSLFRQVVPARESLHEKSSHGSLKRFGLHVDNPDLPLRSEPIDRVSACPEYLSLYSVRCDTRVATVIVPVDGVVARCSPTLLDAMRRPEFGIRRPDSFGDQKCETVGLPMLSRGPSGEWLCRFDDENSFAVTAAAEAALTAFREIVNHQDLSVPLLLLPGDFLILKNQRILHARDAFIPRMNGMDRWLIRLFGVEDKRRVRLAGSVNEFEVIS